MKAKLAIIGAFVIAIIVIVAITINHEVKGKDDITALGDGGASAISTGAGGGATPTSASAVEISLLYSSEKKDWIEWAAGAFAKEHPEIKVKLIAKGSMDGEQAIL